MMLSHHSVHLIMTCSKHLLQHIIAEGEHPLPQDLSGTWSALAGCQAQVLILTYVLCTLEVRGQTYSL